MHARSLFGNYFQCLVQLLGAHYFFTVNIHLQGSPFLQGPNTTDRTTDNTCLLIETKPERGTGASASSRHRAYLVGHSAPATARATGGIYSLV